MLGEAVGGMVLGRFLRFEVEVFGLGIRTSCMERDYV